MVGVLYLSLNPREKTSILCIYIFTVATSFNLYISAVFSLVSAFYLLTLMTLTFNVGIAGARHEIYKILIEMLL